MKKHNTQLFLAACFGFTMETVENKCAIESTRHDIVRSPMFYPNFLEYWCWGNLSPFIKAAPLNRRIDYLSIRILKFWYYCMHFGGNYKLHFNDFVNIFLKCGHKMMISNSKLLPIRRPRPRALFFTSSTWISF